MKSGFMDFVATHMVPDSPGKTARWYATEYLELGDNLSDAKNPIESLANTLDKQVREEREKRIRRERIGGKYLFFPVGASLQPNKEDIVAQISLSTQELEDIDNLVAVGKFKSRNNTIEWLVTEGIKSNSNYLDKVADTTRQIEQLKKGL